MALSQFIILLCLLAVMLAALLIARFAQEQLEQNMVRLYRLTALDQRRASTRNVIRALLDIDENPELLRILYQSLRSDLLKIQQLDPSRADLENDIRQVQSGLGALTDVERGSGEQQEQRRQKLEQRTSLGSEREIQITRAYISEAMSIIRRLYQFRQVRGEQLESVSRYLGTLSFTVAVNSHLNMGELALQEGDKIKALSNYRRAESLVMRGPYSGRDRTEKLSAIDAKKEQLIALSRSEQGLLLLTATD
ncbi:MAG: hypothetical protein Q7V56_12630 [Gammaproteobacteria bacterium]|nr:hypothetical protein [Gammaproteobacteria bacterium]